MAGIPEAIGGVVNWVSDGFTDLGDDYYEVDFPTEWGTDSIMEDSYGWLDDVDYDYEFIDNSVEDFSDYVDESDEFFGTEYLSDYGGDGDDTEAFIPNFVGDGDDTEAQIPNVGTGGINIPKPIQNIGTGIIKNTLLPSNTSGGNVAATNAAAAKAASDAATAKAVRDAALFSALAAGSTPPVQKPIDDDDKTKRTTYFSPYETDIFGNPNRRVRNGMLKNEPLGITNTLKRKVYG